jgi:hypothetical protein
MPGPTTEAVNDDVKALREDLHQVELSLTKSIEAVRHDVGRLQAEFGLAKWLLGLSLVATVSGIGAGVWWAATLTAEVRHLAAVNATRPAEATPTPKTPVIGRARVDQGPRP